MLVDWQYPNTLKISIKDIMSIYSSQTLGNTVIPRFSTYESQDFNIASYFGGENHKDMAILMLKDKENGKDFKLQLIDFFYNKIGGRIDTITSKEKFKEFFHKNHDSDNVDLPQGAFEQRFDIFLSVFNNFIETIDKRLTQIENLILKIATFYQK